MFIVLVWLLVQEAKLDAFLVATLEMAHASLEEDGCRRFEVLRGESDVTRFVLYEAFNTRADGELHLTTEHFKQWEKTITPMLTEPVQAVSYTQLF